MSTYPFGDSFQTYHLSDYDKFLRRQQEDLQKQQQQYAQQASWLAYANQQNKWNWERGLGNVPAAMPRVITAPYLQVDEPDEFRWLRQRVGEILWQG